MNHLDNPQLQPGIPQNWQNIIMMSVGNGLENRGAQFFVRMNTQTDEYTDVQVDVCRIGSDSDTVYVGLAVS